jgi:nickel-dependent lactate racemase
MQVTLAYGRTGLAVELPEDRTDVVEPRDMPGLPDEPAAITAALRAPLGTPPLHGLAGPDDDVVIVVNDGTRPMPSTRVLPALLAELDHVPRDRITLLVATGTHRANTPRELDEMLGPALARGYRVVNHDARDAAALVYLGESARGHPIFLNRLYVDASVKILTGFVEPHFFAGFSGGPKPVMPGLAGLATVLRNHGPHMIAHPGATFGILEGNPIHEEQREIALRTRPTFSLNVALNKRRQITGVWAGEMMAVHAAGVAFVRATAMQTVSHEYDVVLTTNSGYPLDQNLYQSVKGMAAAARALRPGGAIVLAAECADGLPAHGTYATLLREATDPEALLARVEGAPTPLADGWQAQIQARIQRTAAVSLYSSLPDEVVRSALLVPCHDVEAEVRRLLAARGPDARLLVLPEGPQTVVCPAPSAPLV